MKVIFLDFDGVITIPHKWDINIERLKNLKKIVDATGAKIVISSSWRSLNVEDTINKVIGRPKRCPKNKMMNWFLDNIYDITPWVSDEKYRGEGRGGEIQTWLDSHSNDFDIEEYVIFDDDSDMMKSQLFHFIQTDYTFGLLEREVQLAIALLNGEKIINSLSLNYTLRYEHLKKCDGLKSLYDDKEFMEYAREFYNTHM